MHILLLGYSNIVRKRVLPALVQMQHVTGIDIASKTSASKISLSGKIKGRKYNDYQTALSVREADLVYVSLVNSAHAEWVGQTLEKGFHCIVDKPAFTGLEDAARLVELSKRAGLCLAESTVYTHHPQIQLARDIFLRAGSAPTRLSATFSFPPLNSDNFRYKKELGGGSLWDIGPYAASLGRIFFNSEPEEVLCRVCSRTRDVDTSFSLLASYPDGRSMVGHFGFNTEYRNHLNILGQDVSIDMERVFTTPADMENEIRVRQRNKSTLVKAPRADSFLLFLRKVIDAVQTGKHHVFADNLLMDASVLHRMRISAREE